MTVMSATVMSATTVTTVTSPTDSPAAIGWEQP